MKFTYAIASLLIAFACVSVVEAQPGQQPVWSRFTSKVHKPWGTKQDNEQAFTYSPLRDNQDKRFQKGSDRLRKFSPFASSRQERLKSSGPKSSANIYSPPSQNAGQYYDGQNVADDKMLAMIEETDAEEEGYPYDDEMYHDASDDFVKNDGDKLKSKTNTEGSSAQINEDDKKEFAQIAQLIAAEKQAQQELPSKQQQPEDGPVYDRPQSQLQNPFSNPKGMQGLNARSLMNRMRRGGQ